MNNWQPIDSFRVKSDKHVVLGCDRDEKIRTMWQPRIGVWVTLPGGWQYYPTHWMPLPKPPTK